MQVVILATLRVVIGGGGGQPHARVVVIELAAQDRLKILLEVGDRLGRDVAHGVKGDFAQAVVDIVVLLRHLPQAGRGLVAVAALCVEADAVLQLIWAAAHVAVDHQIAVFKGGAQHDRADLPQNAAVCGIEQFAGRGILQHEPVVGILIAQLHARRAGSGNAGFQHGLLGIQNVPCAVLVDADPEILTDVFPEANISCEVLRGV